MKTCTKCKKSKGLTEFGKNSKKTDGLQSWCKLCVRSYNRAYYKKTPEKNKARTANNERSKKRNKEYVIEYLKTHPCVDCGETDIIVLEFDHVSGTKLSNISDLIRMTYSLQKIKDEIAKCEVRCANCHRRVTAQRAGWIRTLDLPL